MLSFSAAAALNTLNQARQCQTRPATLCNQGPPLRAQQKTDTLCDDIGTLRFNPRLHGLACIFLHPLPPLTTYPRQELALGYLINGTAALLRRQ